MNVRFSQILISSIIGIAIVVGSYCASIASDECLDTKISCYKASFLPFEPIPIEYIITNISDKDIKFSKYEIGEFFRVTGINGNSYYNHAFANILGRGSLQVGESIQDKVFIDFSYKMRDITTYSVQLQIPGDVTLPECKYDIISNDLQIKVLEPIGDDKKALELLLRADSVGAYKVDMDYLVSHRELALKQRNLKKRESFNYLLKIAQLFPNSPYAPIALERAMAIKSVHEDKSVLIPIGKQLIENYPKYSRLQIVFTELMNIYESQNKLDEANQYMRLLLDKYPNSEISKYAGFFKSKLKSGRLH